MFLSKDLEKLDFFATKFGMRSVFAQVICYAKTNRSHLFTINVTDIKKHMKKVKHG